MCVMQSSTWMTPNESSIFFTRLVLMNTILVVDDERLIRELCCHALTEYRVLLAEDSEEALRLYEKEPVDLVLSDVMMPGSSGLDLLCQIKRLDPNAVVVIMTGFSEKEVILQALKEGADDFIHKPLNLLMLKSVVEKALTKKILKEEVAHLKKLDRFKNNFLSLISHKFKTPITAISLFLQNTTHGVYETSDSGFNASAAMALDEAKHLTKMVDDLLVFSAVMEGAENIEREPSDLNLLIANALSLSRDKKSKPGIETDFFHQKIPMLQLDRKKISFALQQIIDNAYKFSGEEGHVAISIHSDESRACVMVSDTGIGMPAEELPKIFEKFYQIDPDNTGQVRGFGLGLFYAREFIRQHDGGIMVDSHPGLGTTVTITLPCQ